MITDRLERDNLIGSIRVLAMAAFLAGLFILALGAGLFFFKNSASGDDIQIISTSSQPSSAREIAVDVGGEVAKPGVYRLAEGSRVDDAVNAAGGLRVEADRARINLAARLVDGQKVYVAKIGEPAGQGVGGSAGRIAGVSESQLVNINMASEAELDRLPGVGPATAQKIVASRPYSSLADLLGKKVVNKSVYEKIKDLITY